jgi:hypothetical protein
MCRTVAASSPGRSTIPVFSSRRVTARTLSSRGGAGPFARRSGGRISSASNVGGTTKLLQAATTANVPRFVYFSTVAVYGEDTPLEGIAEDAPPASGNTVRTNQTARRTPGAGMGDAHRWRRVLLRLATVYGARDRGNMLRMMEAIRRGRFVLPGDGANCKTCVAVETVAEVAASAVILPMFRTAYRSVVADPQGAYPLRDIAVRWHKQWGLTSETRSARFLCGSAWDRGNRRGGLENTPSGKDRAGNGRAGGSARGEQCVPRRSDEQFVERVHSPPLLEGLRNRSGVPPTGRSLRWGRSASGRLPGETFDG